MASMLLNGKAERIEGVKEDTMIEAMGFYPDDHRENQSSPRVLNTHLTPTFFPEGGLQKGKFIYVIRNPKDACVSIYNHLHGVKEDGYEGSFSGFYEVFRDGKTCYGDWLDILSQWWELSKKQSNFLFLTYEEAKQDLVSSVKKMAEFIQKPTSDELIKDVANLCTFKTMKQNKKEFMKEVFKENTSLYRKGIAGDWKNWFTVAQNVEYDAMFAERTKAWDSELKNLVIF